MSHCNVEVAMSRIRTAPRDSRIAIFTIPATPWLLDAVFDSSIETKKAIRKDDGRWIGSFCKDDFLEVVERVLHASVQPKVSIPALL